MRTFLFCLLMPILPALAAQDTAGVPQRTVKQGDVHILVFQVDQGSTPTAVMCSVSVQCQSPSGLKVRLLDIDEKASLTMGGENEASVGTNGTVNLNLQMPARTSEHPLLVFLQPVTPGDTRCLGNVSTDAGTVRLARTAIVKAGQEGLRAPLEMFATFRQQFETPADFKSSVDIDFGAQAHAMTFSLEGQGSGLSEIRVYDVTGGDVLLGTIPATVSGTMSTASAFTTPAYAGEVRLRIEVVGDGFQGSVFWALWLPSDHPVTGLSGSGVTGKGGATSKAGGGGCTAGPGGLSALPLLLMLASRRRRGVGQR